MIRRDILRFSAGATAGLALSPAPWRLLGDSAIWSQNWSWMPRVPRGELASKAARCTLCPAACAVNARCVGATPVSIQPRQSAMCPAGFVAHHMAYHPLRLRLASHQGRPAQPDDALKAVQTRLASGNGHLAVLDLVPGRTASLLHRHHLAALKGVYLTPPAVEGATAAAVNDLLAQPAVLSADLTGLKSVLSLSTPLLDGWAAPERALARSYRLIQADTRRSRTSGLADEFLPIKPGSETALLLAIANCLLRDPAFPATFDKLEGAADWARAAAGMPPAAAARQTGLDAARIEALAHTLSTQGPAAVIADGDPAGGPLPAPVRHAAAALNLMLGLHGFRRTAPLTMPAAWNPVDPTPLAQTPDRSIAVLLIDEPLPGLGLPWQLVEPKLAHDAVVVALTWNRANFAARAHFLVPTPALFESPSDAAPAHDTARHSLAVTPALIAPPAGVSEASSFTARLAGDETPFADRFAERLAALGADPKAMLETAAIHPSQAEPQAPGAARRVLPPGVASGSLLAAATAQPAGLQVVAHGWRNASVSPMLAKLWQESDLRDPINEAAAHPSTLTTAGLTPGQKAILQASCGSAQVRIEADPHVSPGLISLSAGPAYAQLCEPSPDGAWRAASAKVVPA